MLPFLNKIMQNVFPWLFASYVTMSDLCFCFCKNKKPYMNKSNFKKESTTLSSLRTKSTMQVI